MRLPAVLLAAFSAVLLADSASTQGDEPAQEAERWLDLAGKSGPGEGKRIVFVTGDEEYRSEEGMPQLARILAERHGFDCRVTFAIDEKTGAIDPNVSDNIPGLGALAQADLMVIFTRYRDLPDAQMKHIVEYVAAGKPIVGLRTATHAFRFKKHKTYERYQNAADWAGGFGRQVLGEKWIAHHGGHGRESSRGVIAGGMQDHPILRGITPKSIWDPADVYRVRLPMLEGIQPLVLGQCLAGMKPDSKPLPKAAGGKPDKNDPMMPVAWIRTYSPAAGKSARVFCTTLGSAPAFTQEGTRRLLVNACYWAVGLEDAIAADADVGLVGDYQPSMFGFDKFKKGVKPAQLR